MGVSLSWIETHRRLDRGRPQGWEHALAVLLYPCSLLFGAGVLLRNAAYDLRLLPTHAIEPVVIGVGSLSAGGAGKTPFAAMLARMIRASGHHPLLVSRGYGAKYPSEEARLLSTGRGGYGLVEDWQTAGEEAVLLARLAPEVPVAISRRREDAYVISKGGEIDPTVLILDGAFQYRRLHMDYDIVLIDSADPPRRARLLPLGDMREPWHALRRADHIILHRAELCPDRDAWERWIRRCAGEKPVAWCENRLGLPRLLSGEKTCGWADLAGQRLGMWTALGHPDAFLRGLEMRGIRPLWRQCPRDHAPFGHAEIDQLIQIGREQRLRGFLVTEKDAVKMEAFAEHLPPVYVVPATLSLVRGGDVLERNIRKVLTQR